MYGRRLYEDTCYGWVHIVPQLAANRPGDTSWLSYSAVKLIETCCKKAEYTQDIQKKQPLKETDFPFKPLDKKIKISQTDSTDTSVALSIKHMRAHIHTHTHTHMHAHSAQFRHDFTHFMLFSLCIEDRVKLKLNLWMLQQHCLFWVFSHSFLSVGQ